MEKAGILQAPVGKASFGGKKIAENIQALLAAVNKAKPSTSKGVYLKRATIACTMGPGVNVDVAPLRA